MTFLTLLTLLVLALGFGLDCHSTLIKPNPQWEQSPFWRWIWINMGRQGFVAITIIFYIIVAFITIILASVSQWFLILAGLVALARIYQAIRNYRVI